MPHQSKQHVASSVVKGPFTLNTILHCVSQINWPSLLQGMHNLSLRLLLSVIVDLLVINTNNLTYSPLRNEKKLGRVSFRKDLWDLTVNALVRF